MLNNTLIATKLALFRITFTKEIASSVKWTDWNIVKTYILVWYDYPKLDGLTMGDKQQDKCELIGCLSIFYKQYIPTLPLFVNYFHTIQNQDMLF